MSYVDDGSLSKRSNISNLTKDEGVQVGELRSIPFAYDMMKNQQTHQNNNNFNQPSEYFQTGQIKGGSQPQIRN